MDYSRALGAEFREVGERNRDGQPVRVMTATRVYETDPADLWSALTDPERVPRWFLPISGDLRPQGRYQLKGHAGGQIERCEPPTALNISWEMAGSTSWVSVRLAPNPQGTLLTLEHCIPIDEAGEPHWQKFGPGATGVGWELALMALGLHVANDGATIDQEENQAWTTSDSGKAFARACADAWGAAHIKSGEAADIALGMAKRTGDFYTGE